MRVANGLFAVAFLLSAAVQVNDPDPLPWIAIYLAALGATAAWERRVGGRWAPAPIGVVAAIWCGFVAAGVRLEVPVGTALSDWQMHSGGSEELRESLGLLLVAGWMGVLAARPREAPVAPT